MNVSKNQVVCARCHLTGLASGIDCAVQSSADNGPARAIEVLRTLRYRLASSASAGAERGYIADSHWVAWRKNRDDRSPRLGTNNASYESASRSLHDTGKQLGPVFTGGWCKSNESRVLVNRNRHATLGVCAVVGCLLGGKR